MDRKNLAVDKFCLHKSMQYNLNMGGSPQRLYTKVKGK